MERPNPRCKKTTFEKNKISHSELTSIINGLEKLEGYVGEEYLTILHAKMVESIAQEQGINLKHYKTILEWIVEDEKRHEQTLNIIKNFTNLKVTQFDSDLEEEKKLI